MPICAYAKTTNSNGSGIYRPFWTYIQTVYNWMDINSSGKATMVSDMDTYTGTVTKVKMTNYLQRYQNGSWTTVNSWSQTTTGTYGYWSDTYYVYSGYNYRLLTHYYAYNGTTLLESTSLTSGTVYY
jgi:hypothetical protein